MNYEHNVIFFADRLSDKRRKVAHSGSKLIDSHVRSGNLTRGGTLHSQKYVLSPVWESAVESWIEWLRIGGSRPTTLKLRRGHVRMIAKRSGAVTPAGLSLAMIVDICAHANWSNDHRKGIRASLNSFFEFCVANDLAGINPAAAMPKVAGDSPRPRPATDEIWRELLANAAPRERMMARLAGEAGMRRAEVAVCHRDDLIQDVGGYALLVHGKGGKQRVVPITDGLAQAIRDHCAAGFLFPGAVDGHVAAHHVGKLLSALMPDGWSMHKLRHRFATLGFAGTGDLLAVRDALGHASVATTQIYTAVARQGVRRVAEAASGVPRIAATPPDPVA